METALCSSVYIRTVMLVSPVLRAVGIRDANLEETRLAIDAHAVLISPWARLYLPLKLGEWSTILLSVRCATRPTGIPLGTRLHKVASMG